MKFCDFEKIVREKYPEAEVFPHGEFGSRSKINVTIILNPRGKCYSYNGTYCEVLNKIGIKSIYRHDIEAFRSSLERAIKSHGKESFFGKIDNSKEIEDLKSQISDFEKNYLIV